MLHGGGDADTGHGAGAGEALDEDETVNLRGVAVGASDEYRLAVGAGGSFDGLDEDGDLAADESIVDLSGNIRLQSHESFETFDFDGLGHLVRHGSGWSAVLGRVKEGAGAVEAGGGDEVEQLLELVVGLAGEADDEGGADGDVRHGGAEAGEGVEDHRDVVGALHTSEDGGAAVLKGDVEVVTDLRNGGHGFDEWLADASGIGVHKAEPGDLRNGGGELAEQGGKAIAVAGFFAVCGAVLGDEDELLDASVGVSARLADKGIDRSSAEGAALDAGDIAEGAGAGAAV